MAEYSSNIELAQEISARIGTEPIPFESVSGLCYQIYEELGGTRENYDDVYAILLDILPLTNLIDDSSITTNKTWSSSKINTTKQNALTTGDNISISIDNVINAKGYSYNSAYESVATNSCTANNDLAGAEGGYTKASGRYSHAEGYYTEASGSQSHAEGHSTKASNNQAHAEGWGTKAKGKGSHSEGDETVANGNYSHAEGESTYTENFAEHAMGCANISHKTANAADSIWQGDGNHTLLSIGNGGSSQSPRNAVEVMQNGDVYIKGVGGYDGENLTGSTLQTVISGKQNTLTAGQNIVINGNTISAVIDAGFAVDIVSDLPTSGETNTIYFVPVSGGTSPDVYDEYMYINDAWEMIGSTAVDLTNYYTKGETDNLLAGKQGTLTAGTNITISNGTISATDTTYSAGDNIGITGTTINALGYRYDTSTGAFAEGDRDINDGGTTRVKSTATGVLAHAEGINTNAIGRASHAEGNSTIAQATHAHTEGAATTVTSAGTNGHAEGRNTTVNGYSSHAEGESSETGGNYTSNTKTAGTRTGSGDYSHAEGNATIAKGVASHSEGQLTFASGARAHAEGSATVASGINSHAEGGTTEAKGTNSHTEGQLSVANGYASHAEGDGSETGGDYGSATTNTKTPHSRTEVAGDYAHAEGLSTIAYGICAHSEGKLTFAKGNYSHAEGQSNTASAANAHAEGNLTIASGLQGHAEGYGTTASSNNTHAEGQSTQATTRAAHSEGMNSLAAGYASHTEGYNTETGGNYTSNTKTAGTETGAGSYSHAEGNATLVTGRASHAEGQLCFVSANNAHAEGYNNVVAGNQSHAEGSNNTITSNAQQSHAEGARGVLSAQNSHTEGYYGITTCFAEHMEGTFNVSHHSENVNYESSGNTRHSIGIGTADNARMNAVEVMQNGDVYIKGVGSYAGTDTKSQDAKIQTLQDVITSLYWELNRVKVLAPNQIRYTVKDGIRFSPFDAAHRIVSEEFNVDLGLGIINYAENIIETGELEFSTYAGQNTITSIELPKSNKFEIISVRSFRGQEYLTQFTIPLNIIRIDDEAFMDCASLEIVKYEGTKQMWSNIRLGGGVFANTMVTSIYCIDGVVNI